MPDRRDVSSPQPTKRGRGWADGVIAAVANPQAGYVARHQLIPLGVTDAMILARVRAGVLIVVHRGVYAFGTPDRSYPGRCWAAVLDGGPEAVLSHLSAAVIWGLRSGAPWAIQVTVPTRRRPRDGIRFHVEVLPADEVTSELGIPMTTAVRTAFDCAGSLQPAQTERLINEIEVAHLWGTVSFAELLERHPHRWGGGVLRTILAAG